MLKSFEKGIKKSLPVAILDDEEIMEKFKVTIGTNEPTAYALCALNRFNLIPTSENKKYIIVFLILVEERLILLLEYVQNQIVEDMIMR